MKTKKITLKDKLLEIVDDCKTQKEAAKRLNTSEPYIYLLTQELGITKWRQKNRVYVKPEKDKLICEECGEYFFKKSSSNRKGRFCSKKCQGKWLGKTYGFKKELCKTLGLQNSFSS